MVIAYCTGLIAVCTVLLLISTVLTIRSYNLFRNMSDGGAGAHDEAQIRLGKPVRPGWRVAQTVQAQRSELVVRASVERAAPAELKKPKKRNIPIARYDSDLEETMGATEWTGPVTTYIPENRSPQKP